MLDKTERQEYQLFAVLNHIGKDPTSGHYVVYICPEVKNRENWYLFNDQLVQQVPEQVVFANSFGGSYTRLVWDETASLPSESVGECLSSAYMLVYLKKHFLGDLLANIQPQSIPPQIKHYSENFTEPLLTEYDQEL
jgi:hypothetical protein